ncbi:MAG TPA: cysteine desulfurase family protein [Candidatus Limnocylindria bacterium]
MKRVYLDHAATTPVAPEVAEAMARVYRDVHGNPSSVYAEGRAARALVDEAREQVAAAIGATPAEIVFTSGGTEADNLALRGVIAAHHGARDGLVTSAIEHHAVLDTARDVEARQGVRLTVIGVERDGRVAPDAVAAVVDERISLVSVMHANNEIGTIEPIAEIGAICRARGVTFHSDAVQSTGALPFDVRTIPVDLVSLNAHKFYGPKGVGALYVRKGTRIATVQTGGGQERGRRTGTENVAGIVGLGVAVRIATDRRETESARQAKLRDRIIDGALSRIRDAMLTGHRTARLPNNASFCIRGADGPSLVTALDLEGFAVSSGSACTSGTTEPSHVLLALGLDEETAKGSLRVTVGRSTTDADVDAFLAVLPKVVERIRGAAAVST